MKILQGEQSGFCSGATNAIKSVYDNLHSAPLYTYGRIIHNNQILSKLESEGVICLEDEKALESVKEGTVIIRAHGIPPKTYAILNQNKVNYIDSTCVFVKKVHTIVDEYFKKGYKIIIIGKSSHPEVIGTNGYTNNSAYIIEDVDDIHAIDINTDDPICLVAQTTFNTSKYDQIMKCIEAKYNNLKVFNTLCHTTLKRQKDTERFSEIADVVMVIGDQNSSNTRNIYHTARKNCERTFYIKSVDDIHFDTINDADTIYVQGSASTPIEIVEEVIESLEKLAGVR